MMYFCQSVHYDMQYTKSRDKQSNHLVSHCNRYWSQSVFATDNICQECVPSPAKARGNETLCKQFHEMVAQVNKVHTVTVAPDGLL